MSDFRTWYMPILILVTAVIPGLAPAPATGGPMAEPIYLVRFSGDPQRRWSAVDDVVMGGVSRSDLRLTDSNTGLFTGALSLENNGGFASVRTAVEPLVAPAPDGLELRVRGDGRIYQLRLRTDDRFDGIAYRAEFQTTPGTWTVLRIPFDAFAATFRGRGVPDAPPLDTTGVTQLSFMVADGNPGPFSLEIDFVRTWAGPVGS